MPTFAYVALVGDPRELPADLRIVVKLSIGRFIWEGKVSDDEQSHHQHAPEPNGIDKNCVVSE